MSRKAAEKGTLQVITPRHPCCKRPGHRKFPGKCFKSCFVSVVHRLRRPAKPRRKGTAREAGELSPAKTHPQVFLEINQRDGQVEVLTPTLSARKSSFPLASHKCWPLKRNALCVGERLGDFATFQNPFGLHGRLPLPILPGELPSALETCLSDFGDSPGDGSYDAERPSAWPDRERNRAVAP